MRIIITEDQMSTLLTEMANDPKVSNRRQNADGNADHNPKQKQIDAAIDSLEKLLDTQGTVMINTKNGKEYLTYEIYSLANTIGKRYCICRLLRDGEPYGTLYTRPLTMFKPKNY